MKSQGSTKLQGANMPNVSPLSRREFLQKLTIGGGSFLLLAGCGVKISSVSDPETGKPVYSFIAVDYTKCAGCRTCEAVCAASNHPVLTDGRFRSDIGNPQMANIRVHSFNPAVSAPVTCARCPETPCVEACPVDPSSMDGRKAIFQTGEFGVITHDPERCLACGSCVEACSDSSVGILAQHPETNQPLRMCTLCDGDPQCVVHCPYEAMSILQVSADYPFYRRSPRDIADTLNKQWYELDA